VVEAKKAEDIEEAEELEDSKAEETGTQPVRVPNNPRLNCFHMELEEKDKQSHMIL
jgi:hypothetical protein